MDLKAELARLKECFDANLIDEADYRKEKDALLSAARTGSGGSTSGLGNTGSGNTGPGVRRKPDTNLTIDDEVSPFFPGAMLGQKDRPYKLGQRLGAGGMGQVWQAQDIKDSETLGREVWKAVKILPVTAESDPGQYKALMQEAMLAEQLRHPHIVSVFGWREDQITGIPFIVMEWLQGKNLGTVLAEEGDPGLPFERVVSLLDPVIEALDYAWKKHQLVHRDIKPANLFLTEAGEIKLLDFGIAARIGKTASSIGLKGREQAGTPGYRPPEAKAKRKPAPSWDVYGLGALTYELLTGTPPFDEDRAPYTPAPDAPENLNEAQWEVLQKAFAFDEPKRIAGVKEFWQALQKARGPAAEEIERQRQEEAAQAAAAVEAKQKAEAEAKQRADEYARRGAEERARREAQEKEEAERRDAARKANDAREAEAKEARGAEEAYKARQEAQAQQEQKKIAAFREQARQEAEERPRKEAQEKKEAAEEQLLWQRTTELNTLGAYQNYLDKSKRLEHKQAAQENIVALRKVVESLKKIPWGRVVGILALIGGLAVLGIQAKKEPQAVEVVSAHAVAPAPTSVAAPIAHQERDEAAWAESDNGADINWNEATRYCASKGSGWRLPSVAELESSYQSGQSTPCGQMTCKVASESRLTGSWFWSNESAGSFSSFSYASAVYLTAGNRVGLSVTNNDYGRALCVRRP